MRPAKRVSTQIRNSITLLPTPSVIAPGFDTVPNCQGLYQRWGTRLVFFARVCRRLPNYKYLQTCRPPNGVIAPTFDTVPYRRELTGNFGSHVPKFFELVSVPAPTFWSQGQDQQLDYKIRGGCSFQLADYPSCGIVARVVRLTPMIVGKQETTCRVQIRTEHSGGGRQLTVSPRSCLDPSS